MILRFTVSSWISLIIPNVMLVSELEKVRTSFNSKGDRLCLRVPSRIIILFYKLFFHLIVKYGGHVLWVEFVILFSCYNLLSWKANLWLVRTRNRLSPLGFLDHLLLFVVFICLYVSRGVWSWWFLLFFVRNFTMGHLMFTLLI